MRGPSPLRPRRLLSLIDEVLDFSKIEAGKVELRAERRSRSPTRRRAWSSCLAPRGATRSSSIGWLRRRPIVPRTVIGDEMRVRQVLPNLVGNAIKFTEQGGVALTLQPAPSVARQEREVGPYRGGSASRARHGARRSARRDRAHLRRVRAGSIWAGAASWRHRAWACHLKAPGRRDGRPHQRGERPRRRRDLHRGSALRYARATCRSSAPPGRSARSRREGPARARRHDRERAIVSDLLVAMGAAVARVKLKDAERIAERRRNVGSPLDRASDRPGRPLPPAPRASCRNCAASAMRAILRAPWSSSIRSSAATSRPSAPRVSTAIW